MHYRLALEDIEPQHWIAWMLDLPGCYSSGITETVAVKDAPDRIADYCQWLSEHDPSMTVPEGPYEIEVVETFHSFPSPDDPDYLVNAFFEDDLHPLAAPDVKMALQLFDWTGQDLYSILDTARPDQLCAPIDREIHKSILGIVEHIARAENWYFDQLDLGMVPAELPEETLELLEAVRSNARSQIPKLLRVETITENCGERWSARKVIRRTLWHERDHTQHIATLLLTLPG